MEKIWVLGDAVVDLLPDGEVKLLQCPGGAPANVAVGIARLGGKSAFIGRVGDDPFGRFMAKTLADERVDVKHMRLDPAHRTSTVVVDLDDHGERSFTFMVRPSADLFLEPADLPTFSAGEWLHVCSIALSAEPSRSATFQAMDAIRKAGGNVSFDPNIRPDLWPDENALRRCLQQALQSADVVKLSVEELAFLTGDEDVREGLNTLMQRCPARLVLVTQGKEGVIAWHEGAVKHYPATPVQCVDTTGAGDAFVAGLLYGLAAGQDLVPAIALAQRCGALATTAKGAMTALPWQHDL
ncbi:aminoimidazole riboside kinase [Enterobacter cloacae complex sp. P3B]|uniref:aminoimidazole riboside kinase n=1 Tax=Enterobacter TaxID=547 RepID=UPI001865EB86|nr:MULTISPECIES: aminoimidazole riboside kinase [Enterobacter]MBE3177450.1 aminoimidazole riboside kinase [Enterobacter cloacae complex sp. P26RS]MBE3432844.1 aminoimidazole riboside kinase [Enterobacter cloacae complex sp. P21RS]MBE3458856.1 aminoimidazole riboside kinase [Enterobacter cloacae complex sp. P21C]MBE3499340.1 aminoimidazole riboside kinase [Enterobacter cloacae complex sp. P2B]MBE3504642.1 aminoimidazole riboside kinase [Enterobacter cloacae complex sp. I11]